MLRHTFASQFVMAGGSLCVLQQLLGHSTPLMTQRYAHLAPAYLAGEVTRLDFSATAPAEVTSLDAIRTEANIAALRARPSLAKPRLGSAIPTGARRS
jgi:hypothetical protein